MLIATIVKRSFPARKASRRFTSGSEIRIANPFIRVNPIRRPSRYAGIARKKPFATRWVSERGKMRKKAQSNKGTEGNAMNSKLSLAFGHLRPWGRLTCLARQPPIGL